MAEIVEEQATKQSLPGETKPPTTADVANAMFVLVSGQRMSREEFVSRLESMIYQECEVSQELGLRQGFAIAEGLAKLKNRKPPHKAIRKIARILENNPEATTREIFQALDDADILLYKSKSVPKHARQWSDVVKEPYYKNLVSRLRKQADRAARLRGLQIGMKLREMGDGVYHRTLV